LTPQVGFTRLAARSNAELEQARVPVQSIFFAKRVLRSGWTTELGFTRVRISLMRKSDKIRLAGSSPRVTPKDG